MVPLFRLALGGRLGRGRQYWPWVALDDEVGAIRWLLDHDVRGPVNLTGPRPVTNAEFTRSLGEAVHRPAVLPVPPFAPELLLGRELARELLFASARVVPAALEAAGYRFRHPDLESALAVGGQPCRRASGPRRLIAQGVHDYFGGMRMPPSMRTVSPFM